MKKILGIIFILISLGLISFSMLNEELMQEHRWVLTFICSYLAFSGVSLLIKSFRKSPPSESNTDKL